MKQLLLSMLLLASIVANAQIHSREMPVRSVSQFAITTNYFSGLRFLLVGKDSVTDIIIVGDTLAVYTELLRYINKQSEELRLATSVLEMIDLDMLFAESRGNQEFFRRSKAYSEFIKKKR